MQVQHVMTSTVRTARQDDDLRSVASAICELRISGMPVVDDENRLIGIISEKDLLGALLPSYSDYLADPERGSDFETMESSYPELMSKKVGELMATSVYTCSPDDPVLEAASRMTSHHFRRLPVVDGENRLLGILSLSDIHQAIFKQTLAQG
uniref:CBS domain-containing protein n=1 Tax=Magnetococcus massalia (strain MO-1) TaxID=451514 RepID=A0A1S7LMH5_MAGMO|nr:conserved protein of unknown function [Include CBS domain] [Candidatus Magnetococcus massalia]